MSTVKAHQTTLNTARMVGTHHESDTLIGLVMLWAGPLIAFLVALVWSW